MTSQTSTAAPGDQKDDGKSLGFAEKLGYGVGDLASNLFWMSFIFYLSYFYTDIYGLSAGAVATMLLITRLADTFIDPILGAVADRTRSRWGRFRPYLFYMAVPYGIAGVLTFTTPPGGETTRLIWAYVTYSGMMVIYSAINIPYSALMGVMSSDSIQRTQLSTFRFACAYIGGITVQWLTLPLASIYGGAPVKLNWSTLTWETFNGGFEGQLQFGWQFTAIAYGLIASLLFLFTFVSTKERVQPAEEPKPDPSQGSDAADFFANMPGVVQTLLAIMALTYAAVRRNELATEWVYIVAVYAAVAHVVWVVGATIKEQRIRDGHLKEGRLSQDVGDLLKNQPWIILFASGLTVLTYVCVRNGSLMYYFKYFLNDEGAAPNFMLAGTVANLLGALSTAWLTKFFGKKRLYLWCLVGVGICTGLVFVAGKNMVFLYVLNIIAGFLSGPQSPLIWSMYADSADYSEWVTGRRATGLVFSAASFGQKMGWTLGGTIAAVLLDINGFKANMSQNANTTFAILLLMSLIPAVLVLLSGLAMLLYPIDEKQLEKINAELAERRAKSEEAAATA